MSVPRYDQQNVTIFWDFETTQISTTSSRIPIYEAVQNLRAAVLQFGPIKAFRAYWDFAGQTSSLPNFRNELSSLSSSGLTLIDCPGNGRKDAVKILLVDLIAHAWDTAPPHTFVVVTADRDVAYAISTLRMRGYRVVVISPSTAHKDLSSQASVQLDLTQAVLGLNQDSRDVEDFVSKASTRAEPPNVFAQRPVTGSASFTQYKQSRVVVGDKESERLRGDEAAAAFELRDLPAMGARRDSAFSSAHKAGIFGGMEDIPATPDLARGSFGFGGGPLFPRSRSRAETQSRFRADSAPPSMFPTGPYGGPEDNWSSNRLSSKGKEREFPLSEPEDIAPYSPTGPLPHVPYSGSIFEPFGEKQPPFQTAFSFSHPRSKPPATHTSSISSSSSTSRRSQFSLIPYPEPHAETSTVNESTQKLPPPPSGVHLEAPVNPPQPETAAAKTTSMEESSIEQTAKNKPTQTSAAPQVKIPMVQENVTPAIATPAPAPVKPPKVPPTTIASSSKQTAPASTSTAKPNVPPTFRLLVDILRKEGGPMSMSSLGAALLKSDPKAYQNSGHTNLTALVSAASQAGIIQYLLHKREQAWYELRSSYA